MLSPRLSDWRSYLESVPVASDAFMSDVEDLVHERGGVMPRYVRDTDTFFDVMKRSHPTLLKRLQAARLARVHSMITRASCSMASSFRVGGPRLPGRSRLIPLHRRSGLHGRYGTSLRRGRRRLFNAAHARHWALRSRRTHDGVRAAKQRLKLNSVCTFS